MRREVPVYLHKLCELQKCDGFREYDCVLFGTLAVETFCISAKFNGGVEVRFRVCFQGLNLW